MNKFKIMTITLVLFVFLPVKPSIAGPATDALAACIADSTTGRDRKNLIRWVFAAISSNPEISEMSKVTSSMQEDLNRLTAKLIENLLTETCNTQARQALKVDGPSSIKAAFETLGRLAMGEMMQEKSVVANFEKLGKYVDNDRLGKALK